MRAMLWLLALFAAAVGLTLAARYDAGYVLLVLHPWRIEVSFNLFVLLLAVGFALGYLLLRTTAGVLGLPASVRMFRARRRRQRGRAELAEAVRAFLEGRYGRAEQAAVRAADLGEQPVVGALIAARAAHEVRARDRRDVHLASAAHATPDGAAMRIVTAAELLLEDRRYDEALALLRQLPEKHTAALRLELRGQQLARNWDRVLELVAILHKRKVLDDEQARALRSHAHTENLRRRALDVPALDACWQKISAADRRDGMVAAAAARCYLALGEKAPARAIIEASLAGFWDPELVALYADCAGPEALRQVERAESWLAQHPQDAALLLCLGRLCEHLQLWGKAQSYLEAAVSLESSYSAHMALAGLLERLERGNPAREHYRKALELAVAQLRASSGGRRRAAL